MRDRDLKNEIEFFETKLECVLAELESLKKLVPQGASLKAVRHRERYQYFMKTKKGDVNGTYIKKDKMELARTLAQIEYDRKLAEKLQNSIDRLKMCGDCCRDILFDDVAEHMNSGKRMLISPTYMSDEMYIKAWKSREYEALSFKEDYPEFITRHGLRVRSKSEVIIADILDEYGIPFLYEKPLVLRSGTVHPDFTLLDIIRRREVYWEHLGMMEDSDYRNNAFYKIRNYEESGYYQGDGIIYTFETVKYPINTRVIRKMVMTYKDILGY